MLNMKKDLFPKNKNFYNSIPTKILAEMIMMIALSGALYLIKPLTLPQGGSVTFGSMIPIIIFSLRRGIKFGVLTGAIFGLVALVLDVNTTPNYLIVNPIQLLLDYPIAFGFLGIAGILRKKYWNILL
jgi:thiamine transporter